MIELIDILDDTFDVVDDELGIERESDIEDNKSNTEDVVIESLDTSNNEYRTVDY